VREDPSAKSGVKKSLGAEPYRRKTVPRVVTSLPSGRPGLFPTTRWTLILAAHEQPELRAQALGELARVYWRPLYVFFRQRGVEPDAAEDAVQGLLLSLLERDVLDRLSPASGKLRGYLKTSATNHLAKQHERATAQKRGGATALTPEDLAQAERIVADGRPGAENAFDAEWAATVMERALAQLRAEYQGSEREAAWRAVEQFFRPVEQPAYRDVALAHGISLPQLKTWLHRARARFRELVREEIAQTVSSPTEIDAEMAALLKALSP
jgi:DNA-directed RNA polymerase specialized sigma24 family protein